MADAVLKMINISKRFGGVTALDSVNLEAYGGEVLALVGENGAGKSTLMKILGGAWPHPQYGGEVYIAGERRRFRSTRDAERAGVAVIHQELNLVPELSVSDNIFLDRQPTRGWGVIDWPKLHADAQALLDQVSSGTIQSNERISSLSVGSQQLVEIAKALASNPKILVLDEPTSALADQEVEKLFEVIVDLKSRGACLLYISHKMEELERIADRLVVLRDGRNVGDAMTMANVALGDVLERMVGRSMKTLFPERGEHRTGSVALEVKNLRFETNRRRREPSEPISFQVKAGEIVGISGLMGAGRTELLEAIFGARRKLPGGEIRVADHPVRLKSPRDAINAGLALVTEDRKLTGLVLEQSLTENLTLSALTRYTNAWGVLDHRRARRQAQGNLERLRIKAGGLDLPASSLSGGNQQKVVIAKALNTEPKVIMLDEPTRGVDVGAKLEIYRILRQLAESGVAIVMVSSELPEILAMSDRILVMREEALVAELTPQQTTRETVMAYAMGAEGY